MSELVVEAKKENLGEVFDFVTGELKKSIDNARLIRQIKLCVEEIFINISSYAYRPETGPATINVEIKGEPDSLKVVLSFMDSGCPFDPLTAKDPDLEIPLEDREIGGLGIFLVRKTADGISYEYKNGQNILTIEKSLSEAGRN